MSVRRMILLGGVILLLVGAIGLLAPLSASTNDGKEIGCGSGLFQDLDEARSANASSVAGVPILNEIVPHTDYVALCESELSGRRTWSIPVAILGIVVAASSLAVRGRSDASAST